MVNIESSCCWSALTYLGVVPLFHAGMFDFMFYYLQTVKMLIFIYNY